MEEFTGREDVGKLLNRNVLLNAVNSLVSHHPWCTEDKVAARLREESTNKSSTGLTDQ